MRRGLDLPRHPCWGKAAADRQRPDRERDHRRGSGAPWSLLRQPRLGTRFGWGPAHQNAKSGLTAVGDPLPVQAARLQRRGKSQ